MEPKSFSELPWRIESPKSFFDSTFRDATNAWHLATSAFERRKYLRQISALSSFRQPRTLLELGAAEGAFTELVLEHFPKAELDTVEVSQLATDRARERFEQVGHRLRIHHAEVGEFLREDPQRRWEGVFWSECMHYVARCCTMVEFVGVLQRCVDSIAPGGFLCSVNTLGEAGSTRSSSHLSLIKSIKRILDGCARLRMWCQYVDFKDEDGCAWEYELWLYEAPQRPVETVE